MPAKKSPTGTFADLNLTTLSELFVNEDKAREWLESVIWPDGVAYCPHCGEEGYAIHSRPGSKKPGRPGLKKCGGESCGKQFSVRVGTVLEDSKLPISKWLMAYHLMTSSKKGVSSHQMARELGITQKSAWHLCHRIRESMKQEPLDGELLSGNVEADEAYIGGKPRHRNNNGPYRETLRKGPGGTTKAPIMVLVERDGKSRAFPIPDATSPTLKTAVRVHVDPSATLFTDENICYYGLGAEFAGGHHTVAHSRREYVRYDANGPTYVSSNTAESWFALFKRSFHGIHHQMSKKHLGRYCTERSWMWDHRKSSDGHRMVAAIEGAIGKRLTYRPLASNNRVDKPAE